MRIIINENHVIMITIRRSNGSRFHKSQWIKCNTPKACFSLTEKGKRLFLANWHNEQIVGLGKTDVIAKWLKLYRSLRTSTDTFSKWEYHNSKEDFKIVKAKNNSQSRSSVFQNI